jgi:hypothetical protein
MTSSTPLQADGLPDSGEPSGTGKPVFATVEMELGPLGKGRVVINGQEVSQHLTGLILQSAVGEVPRLTLSGPTINTVLRGEGIVEVFGDVPPVSIIIRTLNAAAIEAEALGRSEWGDSKSLTEHILDVIAEAAEEAERGGD